MNDPALLLSLFFLLPAVASLFSPSVTCHPAVVIGNGDVVEVRTMNEVGGGRGVFAMRHIKAGEILLSETPILSTLSGAEHKGAVAEPLHVQLTLRVLVDPHRDALLQQMAGLYPCSIDHMRPDVHARAKRHYASYVQKLHRKQCTLDSAQRHPLSEDDVLILLLKVCFNAFRGGIYVKKPMFNHCCRPNCETFFASSTGYACTYVHTNACAHIHAHTQRHAPHTQSPTHKHAHAHTHAHRTHTHTSTLTLASTRTRAHPHKGMSTHTHSHTPHTHA